MLKKIVSSALISTIIIGFNGCGSAPKPAIVNLKPEKPISVIFPKINPLTGKNVKLIDFSSQLQKFSTIYPYHSEHSNGFTRDYSGLKVKKKNDIYEFTYANERIILKDKNIYTKTNTIFKVSATENSNQLIFKLPLTAKTEVKTLFTDSSKLLWKTDMLQKDIKHIFSKANFLSIPKRYQLVGEVNSKYPANSIYANFKRILGNYSYKYSEIINKSKKQNTFNLKFNGKNLPLYVEVFPYREGSKVKYSTTLPYKITQNGSSLTKQDIKDIQTKISKIIND